MILTVCGTQCTGKTTFVNDFLKTWPNFKKSNSYRDILTEKNLPHSENTTLETQKTLRDFIYKEITQYDREKDRVIHDRSPLDCLVYSLWAYDKGLGGITEEFIDETINFTRDAMRHIDIVLFTPLTRVAPVELKSDGLRSVDPVHRQEIDNIFKAMGREAQKGNSRYFINDDKPGWVEIFGKPHERIEMLKIYLDKDGDIKFESGPSILTPGEVDGLPTTDLVYR